MMTDSLSAESLINRPLPRPDDDTRPFWEACRRRELRFPKCEHCGHARWPPSMFCPLCYSRDTQWATSKGRGRVYTYAVFHQAFHKGLEKDLPYVTAVIKLEDGPRFLSNIVDCGPEEVHIDMEVELTWEKVNEEFTLPKFRPMKT